MNPNAGRQRGFLKVIVVILIGVALLWWLRLDLRGVFGSERSRHSAWIKLEARTESIWYGWLAWYDGKANTFGPLAWAQNKVNGWVSR